MSSPTANRFSMLVCVAALVGLCLQPAAATSEKPADRVVEFVPGIRIDWKNLTVELDAKVVFREGPLELVACSPRSREHESILVVRGRPLHVYQALGLIGLEPGSPVTYDEKAEQWRPPTGDRVTISVRYQHGDKEQTVPVEKWLLHSREKKEPDSIEWVFAGSNHTDDGFGADREGTVVCVVDFATALIAPSSLHSADNNLLWLVANTANIPPLNTPCTLVIRAAQPPRLLTLDLQPDGTFQRHGTVIKPDEIARLNRLKVEKGAHVEIVLRVNSSILKEKQDEAIAALVAAGIDHKQIQTQPVKDDPKQP